MLDNRCRVCLAAEENVLLDLFSVYSNSNYVEKIYFCYGIKIHQKDNMPQKICKPCLQNVDLVFHLKDQCLKIDKYLRKKLKDENQNENRNQSQVEFTSKIKKESMKNKDKPHRKIFLRTRIPNNEQKDPNKPSRKPLSSDFRCFICEETFGLVKDKREHVIQTHLNDKRCRVCDKLCKTALSTERHTKSHFINDNVFLCPVCAETFIKKFSLERHLEQMHGDSSSFYHCDLCHNWKTKYRTNLRRHMNSVHLNIKQFRCPHLSTCPNKSFTVKETLNFHLVKRHNAVFIKCQNCSEKFDTESQLQEHSKSGRCVPKSFKKRNRVEKITTLSESASGFCCEICQRVFLRRSQFSVHYHQKHKANLNCKFCNKEFSHYANLLRHIKTIHEQEKRFSCEICSKSFSQKHSLINHINIHTGDKPFSCNECSFQTGDRSTLAKHRKKCSSGLLRKD